MADGLQINPDKELKFRRASPRAARPGSRAAHLAPFGTRLVPPGVGKWHLRPGGPGTTVPRGRLPSRHRARIASSVPTPRALSALRRATDPRSSRPRRVKQKTSRAEEADPDDDPPVQPDRRRARVQGEDHRAEKVLREAQHRVHRARRDADRARHHAGTARLARRRRGVQGQVPRAKRRVWRRHGFHRALRQRQGGHQGV
jgi:hypothetical protein